MFVCLLLVTLFVCSKLGKKPSSKDDDISGKIIFGDAIVDSNLISISNDNFSSEHCSDNVCISDLKLECSKYYGNFSYKIVLKGEKKYNYAVIDFGEFKAYIKLEGLKENEEKVRRYRYRNYDLTNVSDYTFNVLDDSYSSIFAN